MGHHPRHHRHLLPLVLSALLLRPRHPRLHHTRRDLARALPPRFLSHSKSPKILGINGKRHPMFCSSDINNNSYISYTYNSSSNNSSSNSNKDRCFKIPFPLPHHLSPPPPSSTPLSLSVSRVTTGRAIFLKEYGRASHLLCHP